MKYTYICPGCGCSFSGIRVSRKELDSMEISSEARAHMKERLKELDEHVQLCLFCSNVETKSRTEMVFST